MKKIRIFKNFKEGFIFGIKISLVMIFIMVLAVSILVGTSFVFQEYGIGYGILTFITSFSIVAALLNIYENW